MNELTIHDYLQKKGLNEYGIAGLMGNLFAESGLNPRNLQNSYENVLGMNDNAYVAAVDNGTYTNFVQDKAGFVREMKKRNSEIRVCGIPGGWD